MFNVGRYAEDGSLLAWDKTEMPLNELVKTILFETRLCVEKVKYKIICNDVVKAEIVDVVKPRDKEIPSTVKVAFYTFDEIKIDVYTVTDVADGVEVEKIT